MNTYKHIYLSIGIIWALLFIKPVQAQELLPTCGPETWAITDDDMGLSQDSIGASVLDANGNLIVITNVAGTGNNQFEWITTKYDAQGTVLWRYFFPGTGDKDGIYNDQGYAIAFDDEANIYVTGSSLTLRGRDIVTVKLSSTGQELWTQLYDGAAPDPGSIDDWSRGIAIANNQIYVFGQSWSSETRTDSIVLLYQPDGTFVRQLELPVYYPTRFTFLPSGDWFIAGIRYPTPGEQKVYLTAYAADDTERWHVTYTSPDKTNLSPAIIRSDSQGNIVLVITAYRQDEQGHAEAITVLTKYMADGQLHWERTYYTSRTDIDLAIDPSDNIYVLGNLDDGRGEEWSDDMALKYDATGNQIATFTRPVSEDVQPLRLVLDGDVGVVIVGRSELRDRAPVDTLTTMYYSPSGSTIWVARHPGSFGAKEALVQIVIQSQLYLVGISDTGNALLLVRYPMVPPSGLPQIHIDDYLIGDGDNSSEQNRLLAFVKIAFDRPITADIEVEYFTEAGSALPDVDYESRANTIFVARGEQEVLLQIPIIGDTIVNPSFKQFSVRLGCVKGATTVDAQATVTIIDDDVDRRLWTKTVGDPFAISLAPIRVLIDNADNLYVAAGYYDGQTVGDLLLKFQPDGTLAWQSPLPAGYIPDIHLEQSQEMILTTANLETPEQFDIATQRTNTDGTIAWTHRFDSSPTGGTAQRLYNDYTDAIAYSPTGLVAVAGHHYPIVGNSEAPPASDALLLAITPQGTTKWVQYYTGPSDSLDEAKGVGTDQNGNIYIVGISWLSPSNGQLFWQKYDENGHLLHSKEFYFPDAYPHTMPSVHVADDGMMTLAVEADPFGYILRISRSGEIQWRTVQFGTRLGIRTLVDQHEQTYVFLPAFVKLLNRQGAAILQTSTAIPSFFPAQSVALGHDGFIYGASEFGPEQTTGEAFVGAIDSSGKRLWLQPTFVDQGPEEARINLVAPLNTGGTYVIGYVRPANAPGSQLFLQRYQSPLLPPKVSLANVSWREGVDQRVVARVPIMLSSPATQAIQVVYSSFPGSATVGDDFVPVSGVLTIPAGQTRGYIEVPIEADTVMDNAESFYVRLDAAQNAVVDQALSTVIIIDAAATEIYLPLVAAE